MNIETLRKYRVSGSSLFDYLLTIVGALLVSHYMKTPLVLTTLFLFILGEILHPFFGVKTPTSKFFTSFS